MSKLAAAGLSSTVAGPSSPAARRSRAMASAVLTASSSVGAVSIRASPAGRNGGEGIAHVVATGDGQLSNRHDPAALAGRAPSPAGWRQRNDAGGNDPVVDDAHATGQWFIQSIQDRLRHAQVGVRGYDRVVGVENEGPVRIDELGEAPLRPTVALERAVPIEM